MKKQTPVLVLDHRKKHYAWQEPDNQLEALERYGDYCCAYDWVCCEDAQELYPGLEGAEKIQVRVTTEPPRSTDKGHWLLWHMDAGRLYLDNSEFSQSLHYRLEEWLIHNLGFDARFWATIEEVK